MCSRVDFPAPDGPMIDTNSPRLMSSVMRRNTKDCPYPCEYAFSRFRSEISASTDVHPLQRRAQRSAVGVDLLGRRQRRRLQFQRTRFLLGDDAAVEEIDVPFGVAGIP